MADNAFFQLLQEIKTICQTHNIQYFLGGKVLYFGVANQPMPEDFADIEILMDGKNAKKLMKACGHLPVNRVLEHAVRNAYFRNLDLYYINKESTCIGFHGLDRREFLGVNIPIRIIQPIGKLRKFNPINVFEKLWRTNYSYHHQFDGGSELYEKLNALFGHMSKNGNRFTTFLFRQLLKTKLKGNERYCKVYTKSKRIALASSLFKNPTSIVIEGQSFATVSDIEKYLVAAYGTHWVENVFTKERLFVNTTHADKEYEQKLYQNHVFWSNLSHSRHIRQLNVLSNNVYNQNWRMVRCIYDGVLLQDKLLKQKPYLLRAMELGDYTAVLAAMKKYKKVLDMKNLYHVDIDEQLHQLYNQAKSEVSAL